MAWILLLVAGLLEVGWSVGLAYTQGFTRLWPSVVTVAGMAASMFLLAQAVRTLPVGTAYVGMHQFLNTFFWFQAGE
ncbi:SMR family transporter, partial [Streptomyces sp. NPDC048845]|uniref:SMR family transporter n=1 Tax=Streptomyces sp. NPDC048845 TaxID=3155390 RepID=UPI00343F9CDD